MHVNKRSFCGLAILLGLFCATSAVSRAEGVAFAISIDTSSLVDLGSGYVDIELNPGASDALLVNASIYNVVTDGVLGDTVDTGSAFGSLTGGQMPTFANTTYFNDLFEQITWGDSLNFDVCLCGPGIDGESITGTTFSVSLYAPDGITPLLTTSPDGSLLHIDINPPDGDVTSTVFSDANNDTWATAEEGVCPEPPSAVLFGLGLALMACCFRRRWASPKLE